METNTNMDVDTTTTPKTIIEEHSFTFVNTLVDTFYKFMADVYIEHQTLQNKQSQDLLNETIIKPIQPFAQYFLFKLFYNYGVKRRMSNDYIALLYYSKSAKGYKNTDPITMLCRHMLIDLRSMRIISLGIPKSVKLDEFCNTYSIDKTNSETNCDKYRLYYFTEGTMMTYNPSLKKYNITIINTDQDQDQDQDLDQDLENPERKISKNPERKDYDEDLEDYEMVSNETIDDTTLTNKIEKMDLDNTVEIKFNNQFMYSTRKILGTGKFGSNKSFLDMFEENNKVYNTDLSIIPSELIKDTALVFNIEHPENNIISTIKRNTNTLCAVFRFKPELDSQREFSSISSIEYTPGDDTSEKSFITLVYENFKILGTNMCTQIQVSNYKTYLSEHNVNVNFYLPKVVKSFEKVVTTFEKVNEDTTNFKEVKEQIDIHSLSISQLETMVDNKSKYFHGYILYGLNGERSKITNKKYKELCELKGNKPITIDQSNNKNLFYLYFRLLKQKNVVKFLKEFDTENTSGGSTIPITTTYKQIFMWFYTLIHNYSLQLFKTYHYSFVKKSFNKPDIPYDLKPLCGDLHKLYKSNNTPITNTIVEQYLFDLPASKLFWRLFKPTTENSSDMSSDSSHIEGDTNSTGTVPGSM